VVIRLIPEKRSTKVRIYAVADVHGRPARIERIRRHIIHYAPDVLVIAGDITSYRYPRQVLSQFDRLPIPVLVVRGNTDLRRMEDLFGGFNNIFSLHLNCIKIQGVNFVGASGTVPVPFRSRVALREKRLISQLKFLLDRESVFIAHPPPYGTLDRVMGLFHAGSHAVKDLIDETQPRLMLCGHIHEDFGHKRIGNTHVVNCNMAHNRHGALICIEGSGPPEINLLAGS